MSEKRFSSPKTVFIIVDGIPADVLENTNTPNIDSIASSGGYSRARRHPDELPDHPRAAEAARGTGSPRRIR